MCDLMKVLFVLCGYKLFVVVDGVEVVNVFMLELSRIDVILFDLNFLWMNGLEVY